MYPYVAESVAVNVAVNVTVNVAVDFAVEAAREEASGGRNSQQYWKISANLHLFCDY
ncbi:hypothetical protein JOC55_002152 [Paenibacillus sacheonensis]|nr:hypothetical protein [Paenibacillus sacheonensis]